MKKIAYITSPEWPVQSMLWHYDFVSELSKYVIVDFFLFNKTIFEIKSNKNINFINYSLENETSNLKFDSYIDLLPTDLIKEKQLNYFYTKLHDTNYDFIIANEKTSLVLANECKNKNSKLIYWQTELYTSNKTIYKNRIQNLIRYEKEKIENINFKMFADKDREKVFYEIIGKPIMDNKIYFPISSQKKTNKKSLTFYDLLKIPKNKKIILYNGIISENRYITEMVKCSQKFDDEFCLVISGPHFGNKEYIEYIKKLDYKNKLYILDKLTDSETRLDLASSAYIGLAFYSNHDLNNELTIKSSDKIALYFSANIPIISFNYPCYSNFYNEYKCGEGINDFNELNTAINLISNDYPCYQNNVSKAFETYYCLENNIKSLVKKIFN